MDTQFSAARIAQDWATQFANRVAGRDTVGKQERCGMPFPYHSSGQTKHRVPVRRGQTPDPALGTLSAVVHHDQFRQDYC